jgi:hypothetical protein
MKLFFGSKDSKAAQKALVLYNVAAFIENEVENVDCYLLQTIVRVKALLKSRKIIDP